MSDQFPGAPAPMPGTPQPAAQSTSKIIWIIVGVVVACVVLACLVILVLMLLGPIIGNTFSTINNSLNSVYTLGGFS